MYVPGYSHGDFSLEEMLMNNVNKWAQPMSVTKDTLKEEVSETNQKIITNNVSQTSDCAELILL